jgi:hypothetical protein
MIHHATKRDHLRKCRASRQARRAACVFVELGLRLQPVASVHRAYVGGPRRGDCHQERMTAMIPLLGVSQGRSVWLRFRQLTKEW